VRLARNRRVKESDNLRSSGTKVLLHQRGRLDVQASEILEPGRLFVVSALVVRRVQMGIP
jgi:hypothetical protein